MTSAACRTSGRSNTRRMSRCSTLAGEGGVHALNCAMRAWRKWTLDVDRHALERFPPPVDYLRMSYYERWLARLLDQVVQFKFVTSEELERGAAAPASVRATPPLTAAMSSRFLDRGIPSAVEPGVKPRFKLGQRVRTRNIHPIGHTRLPR